MIILPKNSLTPRGSCFRAFHFPVSLQVKQKKGGRVVGGPKERVDVFPSGTELLSVKGSRGKKANLLFQGTENAFGLENKRKQRLD